MGPGSTRAEGDAAVTGAGLDPKTANIRYHDAAARTYDGKWSISFDRRSIDYVRDRALRMLPATRYGRVLEVGCGTGFFLLNLWQAGFVKEPHGCDISPGMLAMCAENARRLGCDVRLQTGDAEALPYEDRSFDLVVGHAFLHHLPRPPAALAEFHRVLVPGGALMLAGEPTTAGDRAANVAKSLARRGVELAERLRPSIRREVPPPATPDERVVRELEFAVDLHTFEPSDLARWAEEAGFVAVRTETEELLSSLFGWAVRTIEYLVRPEVLTERWPGLAYRSYLGLYRLDQRVLYGLVPKRVFYNALLYGERP